MESIIELAQRPLTPQEEEYIKRDIERLTEAAYKNDLRWELFYRSKD